MSLAASRALTLERHDFATRAEVARALPAKPPPPPRGAGLTGPIGTEAFVDKIAQANIDRFNLLLETETDPIKLVMILAFSMRKRIARSQWLSLFCLEFRQRLQALLFLIENAEDHRPLDRIGFGLKQ